MPYVSTLWLACVAESIWQKERTGAREGDTHVFLARPFLSRAHFFQAHATQATF